MGQTLDVFFEKGKSESGAPAGLPEVIWHRGAKLMKRRIKGEQWRNGGGRQSHEMSRGRQGTKQGGKSGENRVYKDR